MSLRLCDPWESRGIRIMSHGGNVTPSMSLGQCASTNFLGRVSRNDFVLFLDRIFLWLSWIFSSSEVDQAGLELRQKFSCLLSSGIKGIHYHTWKKWLNKMHISTMWLGFVPLCWDRTPADRHHGSLLWLSYMVHITECNRKQRGAIVWVTVCGAFLSEVPLHKTGTQSEVCTLEVRKLEERH